MSGRTYLRAILLAGLITTLLNFNILNCDEEFLIGLISCLFFLIIVVLTRQFIKNQFFQEMDMLFMIFAYLLYSVKDSLIEGTSFSKWVRVQLLTHQSWLIVSKYSLEFELRYLYHSSRFALLKRIASLERINKIYTSAAIVYVVKSWNLDLIKPIVINFLTKFDKRITTTIRVTGGRNILGRICVFHKGGGKKRLYRSIDFIRRVNEYGIVIKIYRSVKRTAFTGIILYLNGLLSNIIMTEKNRIGSLLFNGVYIPKEYSFKDTHGWTVPIQYYNLFSVISNIERIPFKGSQIVRAAGGSAILSTLKKSKYTIKLSSGWQLSVSGQCLATLGKLSNFHHRYQSYKKAGVLRNLGIRPTVRGVVKNPCDHPHGGGEGKGSPPRAQVSPWGKLTKGTPTKNKIKDRINRRLYRNI